jgi:translation initiation factor IF-3
LSRQEAIQAAMDAGMDLVEVAPEADPPVVRIMDFGKHKYRLKKKSHQSHVHQHVTQMKALRLSPVTEEHDLQVKLKQARQFLARRDRVVFNLMFRGRQMLHRDKAFEVMKRIKEELADVARAEDEPKMEGRRLWMVFGPKA